LLIAFTSIWQGEGQGHVVNTSSENAPISSLNGS